METTKLICLLAIWQHWNGTKEKFTQADMEMLHTSEAIVYLQEKGMLTSNDESRVAPTHQGEMLCRLLTNIADNFHNFKYK
jgi:hypothetical protein